MCHDIGTSIQVYHFFHFLVSYDFDLTMLRVEGLQTISEPQELVEWELLVCMVIQTHEPPHIEKENFTYLLQPFKHSAAAARPMSEIKRAQFSSSTGSSWRHIIWKVTVHWDQHYPNQTLNVWILLSKILPSFIDFGLLIPFVIWLLARLTEGSSIIETKFIL